MTKTRLLRRLAPGLNMGQGMVTEHEAVQDKKGASVSSE